MKTKLDSMVIKSKFALRDFLEKKSAGLDGFAVMMIIMVMAVCIGGIILVFSKGMFNNFMNQVETKVNGFFS